MNSLVEILFFLSTTLLVPVIVALLGFVMWALLETGGVLREFCERRRQKTIWRSFLSELHNHEGSPSRSAVNVFFKDDNYSGLLGAFSSRGRNCCDYELSLNKLVSDLEIEAASRLARMSLGIRVGPMLGLMGTLIPLGPALISLSAGNIEQLTHSLVVAFSTTVLGLFVGGMCYGMWLARRQWYSSDLADIEYIFQCLRVADGESTDVPANA